MEHSNDIRELCAAAGVGLDSYYTFSSAGVPRPEAPAAQPQVEAATIMESRSPANGEVVPVSLLPAESRIRPRVPIASWTRLRPESADSQRLAGVAFCSASGGAGATTVTATIARILAKRSESLAICDNHSLPMLPFHFGAPRIARGTWSLLPQRNRPSGGIHIFARPASTIPGDGHLAWLRQHLSTFEQPWDRILLDTGWAELENVPAREWGGLISLIVLAPDPTAAVRLTPILAACAAGKLRTFVLLNRFDESRPLHAGLLAELRARHGATVLPFVIRESDLVADALAEGLSVTEYAPESGVSLDYLRLADWVQDIRPAQGGAS